VIRSLLVGALGLGLFLSAPGCSSGKAKTYKVTGKLLNGGAPLPLPSGGPPAAGAFAKGIQMGFVPFDEEGKRPREASRITFAKVEDDGSYEVPGGLPAGKYVVTVKHTPRGPATEDTLNERFSLARSPIEVEVTGNTAQEIELSKYP